MLSKAAFRACGTLASRLQQKGSLLENGFQCRTFFSLRQGTRPWFSPTSSRGPPDRPPWRTLTQLYLYILAKHPLATRSVTASAIMAITEASCQVSVSYVTKHPERTASWYVKRMMEAAEIGLFITGPLTHFWFNFASRAIPGRDLKSIVKKMAIEKVIGQPLMIVLSLSIGAFFHKGNLADDAAELIAAAESVRGKEAVIPVLYSGVLLFWLAGGFVTYRHVPVHLQSLTKISLDALCLFYTTNMGLLVGGFREL